MVIVHSRSKRKLTGGRYKAKKTKILSRAGSKPTLSKIGDKKLKSVRTIGGNSKTRTVQSTEINVFDPKSKKYLKAKMESVMSNPANRHYVRRNIITKGSIAIDGISLTVSAVSNSGFEVNIIPFSWEHTSLVERKIGDFVNLETDMLGKYVNRYLSSMSGKGGVGMETLAAAGFLAVDT